MNNFLQVIAKMHKSKLAFITIIISLILVAEVIWILNNPLDSKDSTLAEELTVKSDFLQSSSALYVKGNQIFQLDTNKPIILKGAVSDYFRYTLNHFSDDQDLQSELNNVKRLESYGANIIGLYLADFNKIKKHINELDEYINVARENNMYIYLIPVARDFSESYSPVWFWKNPNNNNDLTELIEFLAQRYKSNLNVIYGFGDEPDIPSSEFDRWYNKQKELAQIVRRYNPNGLLLITGTSQYDLSQFNNRPFPFNNVVYQTGGYISRDDDDYRLKSQDTQLLEQLYQQFTVKGLSDKYPVLFGEFGGNVSEDFSSDIDLISIKKILGIFQAKRMHYTGYRLSSYTEGDPLALFDTEGNLMPRGKVFAEYFLNSNGFSYP